MRVLLTTLNAKYAHTSLALRYLREYCADLPCRIAVREFSINQPLLEILGRIYEEQPAVIGFSCSIWNIELTVALIDLVKKVLPDTRIICGGPEVSYGVRALLDKHAAIDYIVSGEGEEAVYRLLEHLQQGRAAAAIRGVVSRAADAAQEEAAVVVDALERIPFPYREEEMAALRDRILYYESSRGCPFCCQYCLSSATRGVRFFPLARVLADLAFFIRHDVRQVKFVDRTFNADKRHYLPIWRFLAKQRCRTNFHFEIAADLLDEEALEVLAAMPPGRVQLEIGVQSTNPATLRRIRRVNHWDKIVRSVTRLVGLGTMHLHLDLIVGLPEEDYAALRRSFNDVYRLQPHMLQIGFLKLLKGSGIARDAAAEGYVFMERAPYQVLASPQLSYGEMRGLQIFESVFEQYYNSGRFRHVLRYLTAAEGDAFGLYEALAAYWRAHELHAAAHSPEALYRHLYAFCSARFAAQTVRAALQLLKLDALCGGAGGSLPEFLPWSEAAFYEETTAFWRDGRALKYLPEYRFTNWRALKKAYHIEVFDFSVTDWQADGVYRPGREAVLFERRAGRVELQCIAPEDLAVGGGGADAV